MIPGYIFVYILSFTIGVYMFVFGDIVLGLYKASKETRSLKGEDKCHRMT